MLASYSEKVMERFLHPQNMGKMEDPAGFGNTENLRCGDVMKIYIKVEKKEGKEYIKDVKFETLGCAAAIAASDMICDLAKGKTLEEAKRVSFKDVAEELGSLPLPKVHCASLAEKALKMAIEDYEKRKK